MERNIDFVCQTLVQTAQQSTTTSQINTVQNNISIKFRRSLFQCTKDSCFNFCNTLFQTMRHLLITHRNFHGKSSDTVRPAYNVIFGSIISQISQGSAYMYLDTFGHTFTHLHIVLTAHIFLNIGCKIVTGNTYRIVGNNTTQ